MRKFKEIMLMVTVLIAMAFVVGGCQEAEKPQPKVWGQGDLPTAFEDFFGNSNLSRLNYKQTEAINEISKRLLALEQNAFVIAEPNEVAK